MTSNSAGRSSRRCPESGLWLFLALLSVYLISYSGSFHSIDEVSVTAMTASLVQQGEVNTDQIVWSQGSTPSQGRFGPDGHLYSKKGIGSALLGAPFYWLAMQVYANPELTPRVELATVPYAMSAGAVHGANLFAETHYGPATEVVPAYVASLLQGDK